MRQVSLSSLNRHAVADRADVGIPKAVCLRNHFKRIFPEASVDARVSMFEAATEEQHLSGRPDFVLDCIDNIETKVSATTATWHSPWAPLSVSAHSGDDGCEGARWRCWRRVSVEAFRF